MRCPSCRSRCRACPHYAGYANFEPNNRAFFLKMVEYGAYPSFLITMDSPAALKN